MLCYKTKEFAEMATATHKNLSKIKRYENALVQSSTQKLTPPMNKLKRSTAHISKLVYPRLY